MLERFRGRTITKRW